MYLRICGWLLAALVGVAAWPGERIWADDAAAVAEKAPPADDLSEALAGQLASQSVTVEIDGRTLAEVWLAKRWDVKADFTPSPSVLYPFKPGELIGLVRYARSGADFRDQRVSRGLYTLRYAQQPVDGSHVGTSDTLDFLVLIPASKDKSAAPMSYEQMMQLSTQVSGSTHPAILSMLTAVGEEGELPAVKHYEDRELKSLRVAGDAQAGETRQKLTIEFVVVGHSPE